MNKLLTLLNEASLKGLKVPFAFDARSKQPSVTLLFSYISFILTVISIICSHFWISMIPATIISMLFWVASVILYRIRNLDKAKLDFDDKSISIEDLSSKKRKKK